MSKHTRVHVQGMPKQRTMMSKWNWNSNTVFRTTAHVPDLQLVILMVNKLDMEFLVYFLPTTTNTY